MSKAYFFFFLFIGLTSFQHAFATDTNPKTSFYYRQIDNKNGLSNSSINSIFQDKDQLLWIGTWDGLNRYDGAHFSVYNHNIDRVENSIGGNVILSIKGDQNNNIWINTIGGISRYNKLNGKFSRYFYKKTAPQKIRENEYDLIISDQGEVFCFAANGESDGSG